MQLLIHGVFKIIIFIVMACCGITCSNDRAENKSTCIPFTDISQISHTFHFSRPLVIPIKTPQITFPMISGSMYTLTVPDEINNITNNI